MQKVNTTLQALFFIVISHSTWKFSIFKIHWFFSKFMKSIFYDYDWNIFQTVTASVLPLKLKLQPRGLPVAPPVADQHSQTSVNGCPRWPTKIHRRLRMLVGQGRSRPAFSRSRPAFTQIVTTVTSAGCPRWPTSIQRRLRMLFGHRGQASILDIYGTDQHSQMSANAGQLQGAAVREYL